MNHRLQRLRDVLAFSDGPGGYASGDVGFDILGIDEAVLTVGKSRMVVGIERAETDEGDPGWIVYTGDLAGWEGDDNPLPVEERAEAIRVIRIALQGLGYHVWEDDTTT